MNFERAIVVDDDPAIRRMLVAKLHMLEMSARGTGSRIETMAEFEKEPADLVILDIKLPDGDGLSILKSIKEASPRTEVIMMTGFGSIETAVEAMQAGAANYLVKPFSMPHFEIALQQLDDQQKLRQENRLLREQLFKEKEGEMLFRSPQMERINRLIDRVAATNASVLIEGESGTGKELVAQALHRRSERRSSPYVTLNCAAVPENLLENELFGHERGAFTGASQRQEGRFEVANGGTLLLDEVTEISPSLQAKLLRVLKEQEFERVGGHRTLKVDVRIMATTNRNLVRAVERGDFRQDLYYRLNVVRLCIPALRERDGEIEYLVREFLMRACRKHGKQVPFLSEDVFEHLRGYSWPGNVRELKNVTERAIILWNGEREIEVGDFAIAAPTNSLEDGILDSSVGFPTVAEMEKRLIYKALKKTNGARNEAANFLGINVRTLRNKLNEYEGRTGRASGN